MAERPRSQLQPRAGPREVETTSKVDGHHPASVGSLVASAPPRVTATNYVKPIQDPLAKRGVFGPVAHEGSPMKRDECVDHLGLRPRRVSSEAEAGVLAEVWALDA